MANYKLQIRQTHSVSSAAVGSILQMGELSLVVCDTRFWDDKGEELDMPRLTGLLAKRFRKAPAKMEINGEVTRDGVAAVRFPSWVYCRTCRKMDRLGSVRSARPEDPVYCRNQSCRQGESGLVSMPWVEICSCGHMGDVQWRELVHWDAVSQRQITCQEPRRLYFRLRSGRHDRPLIECGSCGARLILNALKAPDFLSKHRCRGRHPWLPGSGSEACRGRLQVAGLGDQFVHFPSIVSALDIPPESRVNPRDNIEKRVRDHPDWRRTLELSRRHGESNPVVQQKIQSIAHETGADREHIIRLLNETITGSEASTPADPAVPNRTRDLRQSEYRAFLDPITDYREYERFITQSSTAQWQDWGSRTRIPATEQEACGRVNELIAVTRLREVRALKGFTRMDRVGVEQVSLVPPDIDGSSGWLPAAELFGEGVFFCLDRDALSRLSASGATIDRTAAARKGYDSSPLAGEGFGTGFELTLDTTALPGFIAAHTLAHLMIREMAFECGYPSASLRERLYFRSGGPAMAGILIYLAAGEPGGSLGGIAQLAQPARFASLLTRCIETAAWCALDPVCAEHEGRGPYGLNRAACHSCCLLPETSCECGNLLLDRRLVVSPPGQPRTGLFTLDCGAEA